MVETEITPRATINPDSTTIWQDVRVFVIQGDGAAEFLQGYLTCDCRRLATSKILPMAICTVKGRVLANGWAIALPDGVGLVLHESLLASVAKFLRPYITFSKCTADPTQPYFVTVNSKTSEYMLGQGMYLHRVNTPSQAAEDCSKTMNEWLVSQGFPLVSAPISEQFLPQMLNLEQLGAVDFDKGCYLGQEIVARAQFRGAVKRHLRKFSWQGDQTPRLGETWPDAGSVVAVAKIEGQGQGLAVSKGTD